MQVIGLPHRPRGVMGEPVSSLQRTRSGVRPLAEGPLAPAVLITLAALGWWWSARMAGQMSSGHAMGMGMTPMSISFIAFVAGWVAMMGAMMFPAILPVVLTFRRASLQGR